MPEVSELKYSLEVLEQTPGRVTKFLGGIGGVPVIRTLMAKAYMTNADIDEGGTLLLSCLTMLPPSEEGQEGPGGADTPEAKKQREAVAELDQYDEPNFARYSAMLKRHFPNAGRYVFHNLKASTGMDAVAGVSTFLSRIAALANGSDPQRASSAKEDKKAVALLASRGLDEKERTRLATLVEIALKPTTTLPTVPATEIKREEARLAALTALKDWYEEWAAAARTTVKKRVYLIRLGLAARKSPVKPGSGGEEGEDDQEGNES